MPRSAPFNKSTPFRPKNASRDDFEEVTVHLLDDVRFCGRHADVEIDHHVGELVAVDQSYFDGRFFRCPPCAVGECATRDEHSLGCSLSHEAADEFIDLAWADGTVPFLCLHVDHVQPEPVLSNDAVD